MLATVVALSLAAVALTACSSPEPADEVTSREAASSAVTEETANPSATSGQDDAGTSDGGGAAPGVGSGITPSEQDELEAELAAIERELDAMALPDDTDFSEIEGALQ